jgi:uncharacterized protein (TIGR02246 family)
VREFFGGREMDRAQGSLLTGLKSPFRYEGCGMNYRIGLAVGGALLALVANGAALADEADAIRGASAAFAAAFDKGDAKALAEMWTAEGELIDASGQVYRGRPAIEAAYTEFFKQHPNEKINVAVDSVRMLSSNAAIETGRATLSGSKSAAARYSAIHVQEDGKWKMALVHEAADPSAAATANLSDLDWLVGRWEGEERGAKAQVDCRWLPGKKFLIRKTKVTSADGESTAGIQLIGLNPKSGQVYSWGFMADGGHTIGAWQPQQSGWAISTASTLPSGAETHAINLLKRLDDNAYAWQSVDRSLAGQPLPNTNELIFKRVVEKTAAK